MRTRAPLAAWLAAVLLCVGALAACAEPEPEDPDVAVTGDPGGAPTLIYVTPLTIQRPYRHTIWPGTGPELVEGGPVLLRYWVEDATDGTMVTENYSSSPVPQVMTTADLGEELFRTLSGQRVGARLLQATPPGEGADEDFPALTVVDVLPTRAEGPAVEPRSGLPAVTLGADGSPTISATGTEPPDDLVTQPLLRGSGRQVESGDVVTVQYTGFTWTTGEVFDSTWERGQPASFSLSDVPAFDEGLAEQTTGSQVMLVVPPTYDLGATQSESLAGQTLVFVVDILASAPEGVVR